jgi:hypothetical protein
MTGRRRVGSIGDLDNVVRDGGPVIFCQLDDRDLPACQILLIRDALVTCDEQLEACGLGNREQLPIFDLAPPHLGGCRDVMTNEKTP